jgi:cobalt-zinc-cadmium efflux system protein
LLLEAIQRLSDAPAVASKTVLAVASVAIVINTATALLFLRGRETDLNIRAAFVHMAADAAVSLGVVFAALLIGATGWAWLDPAASIVIAGIILWSGWSLMRAALNLALDAVPAGIDRFAVEAYLAGLAGVTEVHDLHIWGMSTTETALTAHLVRPNSHLDDSFVLNIAQELEQRFGIQHTTIQVESGEGGCRLSKVSI